MSGRRTNELDGYSDSDWAGCQRTARSTSGGAVMRGRHCIRTWSATQKSIALSSGEAELVAVVKMSCEIIGLMQLMEDWGHQMEGNVHADSSAALGIVKRKRNGKMRHVRVGLLWIQDASEKGELTYMKVPGTDNPADLMTKVLSAWVIVKHMEKLEQVRYEGLAKEALKMA